MTEEFEEEQDSQPLVDHLIELRDRLMYIFIAVLVIFLGLVAFRNEIHMFISSPLTKVLEDTSMVATNPLDTFLTPLKLTFYVAIFFSMPIILYQIWAFIAPALYRSEKRLAIPIFLSSVILFYAGVAFAYFVVFPLVFGFLAIVGPETVTFLPDIAKTLELIVKVFLSFGVAFEIPVATFILITAGVFSPETLAKKRPYVIVSCFVIGMFLTPPDIFSQALLAIPMWGLFELGIVFGRFAIKDKKDEDEAEEVEEA